MSLKEEVRTHFTDEEGLVSRDRNPGPWSTGNAPLFTGIYYTLLHLMREAKVGDVADFCFAANPLWVGKPDGSCYEGLLERNDGRPDFEAHDDYIGICAAAHHLGVHHARMVWEYGKAHGWNYDNVSPHPLRLLSRDLWTSWHGRFPGQVGFYKIAAKKEPNCLDLLGLAARITANAYSPKDSVGGKILIWLITTVVGGKSLIVDDAIALWKARMEAQYGYLGNLFLPYFGPTHPFSAVTMGFR